MKIELILALLLLPVSLALISVGIGQQQTIEDLKPGPVTIDLGGGYTASFKLPDIESSYDVEIWKPSTSSGVLEIGPITTYGATITNANSDELARINLGVHDKLIQLPKMELTISADRSSETIPITVDGFYGFVFYTWYNKTSLNPREAVATGLHYFPGSWETQDGKGIEGYNYLTVESGYEMEGLGDRVDLIQSIADSIKVSGPSI